MHAEGFAGGELKHGVIALVEPGTPCVVIAPEDGRCPTSSAAVQVKSQGRTVVGVSPRRTARLRPPHRGGGPGRRLAIVNAVPSQLLGYDLARLRGHDPDKPRNLAKSVTVK